MRILPQFHIPKFSRLLRRLRYARQTIGVTRIVLIAELAVYAVMFAYCLTGRRAAWIDGFGARADLGAAVLLLGLAAAAHMAVRRWVAPALERRFAPPVYDERRILFDLGQEARAATDIDHLYRSIVERIGDELEADTASIFVRDDATGRFRCRIAEPPLYEVVNGEGGREGGEMPVLAADAFVVKRLQHMAQPLVLEAEDFTAWRRALDRASASARKAREREQSALERVRARLLVQIRIKEKLIGILALGPRLHAYSDADKEMLMSVAGQLALVIENSKLIERMVGEEQLRRELALAAQVQQRLFPECAPDSPHLDLAGYCRPARGVGGDYYDFLSLGPQQTAIAIADVAGKGISAALVMSSVQASLRSQTMALEGSPFSRSLGELVANLNRLLCASTGGATYVTFFFARFDETTRRLSYVNAGHNPPMLLRRNGNGSAHCRQLSTGGLFIGLFEATPYDEETLELQSGDLLVAFTDGVTEAMNTAGEEFGEARLQGLLESFSHLPAAEVRNRLVESLNVWTADAPQHDDFTFVVLKVN
ncbi:MAG: SpoIIE family protein phosphatase [Acidobacteria bacterium]|nr:SpoIIE family protein phosphatase [Acidobacteriota bacterium]MCW5969107.1 SpoIIE family protein phosphatase [Blastocatellales bacterium]